MKSGTGGDHATMPQGATAKSTVLALAAIVGSAGIAKLVQKSMGGGKSREE